MNNKVQFIETKNVKNICCFLNKKINKKIKDARGKYTIKNLIVPKYPLLINIINNRDTMHKI